ncbi:MAG: hypothetical protein IJQ39_14800 [Thermoguttaceae bacterium]|nr:hypothetical protein [Thermoguttaceae bacterium]
MSVGIIDFSTFGRDYDFRSMIIETVDHRILLSNEERGEYIISIAPNLVFFYEDGADEARFRSAPCSLVHLAQAGFYGHSKIKPHVPACWDGGTIQMALSASINMLFPKTPELFNLCSPKEYLELELNQDPFRVIAIDDGATGILAYDWRRKNKALLPKIERNFYYNNVLNYLKCFYPNLDWD